MSPQSSGSLPFAQDIASAFATDIIAIVLASIRFSLIGRGDELPPAHVQIVAKLRDYEDEILRRRRDDIHIDN
jgi:hypothetical protein